MTNKQAIKMFWENHPEFKKTKKITDYTGTGKMWPTDVRAAFSNFIDMLAADHELTPEQVQSITLSGG